MGSKEKNFFSFLDNDDDVRQQSIHPSVESHVYDLDLAFELWDIILFST